MEVKSILDKLTSELVTKHKCHTVILYGSHAQGTATPESDYDLMGVRKSGTKYRIARKENGIYVDMFVYPEKMLLKLGEEHLHIRKGKILFQKARFGTRLLAKLEKAARKPAKRLPKDEIAVRKVWAHKMWERAHKGDIEGNYRRAWLQMSLLEDYFLLRGKRFSGSKASFAWLKKNDARTLKLFDKVLKRPTDMKALKDLVIRVTKPFH